MALFNCPFDWTPGFDHPCGAPHNHRYHHHFSSTMRGPRWAFGEKPCCDFCNIWATTPYLEQELLQLDQHSPHHVAGISVAYNTIHHHYQHGLDGDGSESFLLSREINKLSKYLNRLHKILYGTNCPISASPLALLSDDLKYMGRDAQVGPRRLRYRTIPKPNHPFRLLM
ncbi:hypothetical protein IAQ61_001661, partial [Plenodomus lingam]|uniref:Uncharacterized protein n=1 Tax=Leptosphaeria maculans (strain JN3 / isolate v23.1.3 / race Av1-4-5-6-7-8) TaxID=985895 RepID=M1ZJF3_LEPMJ